MSLGFARDSVVNLRSLIHDDEKDELDPQVHGDSDSSTDVFDCIDIDEDDNEHEVQKPFVTDSSTHTGGVDKEAAASHNGPSISLKRYDSSGSSHSNQSAYSGFRDYSDYYVDPYAIHYGDIMLGESKENRNVFCCMFPFLNMFINQHQANLLDNMELSKEKENPKQPTVEAATNPSTTTTTTTTTPSDRLTTSIAPSIPTNHNSTINTQDTNHTKPVLPLKGIMRKKFARSSIAAITSKPDHKKEDPRSRRNLFPGVDSPMRSMSSSMDSINSNKVESKKLSFFMMAKVVTVESRRDLTDMERSKIWWQPSDYDDFKKTARIITQAMIQGGSEIWLQTSNAWGKKQANKGRSISNGDETYHKAIQRYGKNDKDFEEEDPGSTGTFESKWWCSFGHSRRGLEHIVSIEEGKQRQQNVKNAIRAVLDEQERQTRSFNKDAKKLASISMQYTSWARDLSHAAGLADADAVQSRFDVNAQTRFDYLKKGINQPAARVGGNFTTASFILSANKIAAASILDANRSVSTNLKKENTQLPPKVEGKDATQQNMSKRLISLTTGTIPVDHEGSESAGFFQEEIHDPDNCHENIAKLAAGYGHRKNDILSGLAPAKRIGAF